MKDRKVQSKMRYLLAFLIATFLFVFGFSLSYTLSFIELDRIDNSQENTAYAIFEDGIAYTFFGEEICSEGYFEKISLDLGFQGKIIDDLEKKLGKNDRRVLFQKRFYTLVELEHLALVNTMKERCDLDIRTILFFYSNEDRDLEVSEDVGDILSVVHSNNPSVFIYSFDINLDSDLVKKLRLKYGVVRSPTVIIDELVKVDEIDNISDIEEHISSE